MATYFVTIPFTGVIGIHVEADNKEEAKSKAWDADFRLDATPGEGAEVELGEWEMHEQIVQGNVFHGGQNEIEVELVDPES